MGYPPHLHLIVPADGPSEEGQRWCPARANFPVPVKALSKLWRAMLRAELKAAGMADDIDPAVWRRWPCGSPHGRPVRPGRK